MSKRTGENQDYYKQAGQAPGRRMLAREKRKVAQEKAERTVAGAGKVKAIPGSKQTLEFARRAREQKQAERIAREEVGRMLQAEVPLAAPPERQLPQATRTTELADLWRSIEENARSARQSVHSAREAGRLLVRSVAELLRAPVRLLRLVREAAA